MGLVGNDKLKNFKKEFNHRLKIKIKNWMLMKSESIKWIFCKRGGASTQTRFNFLFLTQSLFISDLRNYLNLDPPCSLIQFFTQL